MSDNEKMGQVEFVFWPSGENPYELQTDLTFSIPTNAQVDELRDCCKKFLLAIGYPEMVLKQTRSKRPSSIRNSSAAYARLTQRTESI